MISIIVCTYNRSENVRQTLESFFEQPGLAAADYELIVVDNNSSDDTAATVEQFVNRHNVRYIFERRQGLSNARNRGVEESHGQIVAFLDDDVIVDQNWLKNLGACFEQTEADIVGGKSYLIFQAEPPDWLENEFRINLSKVDLGTDRQILKNTSRLFGLNLAIRKETLQKAGGFDESLGRTGNLLIGGEESAIMAKIVADGGRLVYEPTAIVGHVIEPERLQWQYFKRLYVGFGRTFARNEPEAAMCVRLWRVVLGLGNMALKIPRLSLDCLGSDSAGQKRLAILRYIQLWGILRQRWQYLWQRPNTKCNQNPKP